MATHSFRHAGFASLLVCSWAISSAAPAAAFIQTPVPSQAGAVSTGQAAREQLASIASREEQCRSQAIEAEPSRVRAQMCDSDGIKEADSLVGRSRGSLLLGSMHPDMFEPLMRAMTGGEDTLSGRLVVMSLYFELAQKRAAILTGADVAHESNVGRPSEDLFGWIPNNEMAWSLARRWETVRDLDCAAYPVPNCAARLDVAFRDTITAAAMPREPRTRRRSKR